LGVVPVDGGVNTPGSGNTEVALDIDMVIAMAPALSKVIVYEAPNPSPWEDLLNRMAEDSSVNQFSCSWGGGSPDPNAEQIFLQMQAQGQSFFNASGDSDAFVGAIPFPSESTNITEVGGTTLTTSSSSAWASETVWNRNNGVGSCGGVSTTYEIPYWQQGINMSGNQGSMTMRDIPDVALTAENIYIIADNGQPEGVGQSTDYGWREFPRRFHQSGNLQYCQRRAL
jgi:subtilase family serine protease